MTGHARLAVAAGDALDRVLAGVRAAEGSDLVLDVDERSPLLLSLQHLHTLDEVAQDCNVRLTIATANSKILNAARVFGLDVLDARETPPPASAAGPTRLLAGQPLDRQGRVAADEAPQIDTRLAAERPIVRLTPARQAVPRPEDEDDLGAPPYLADERTAARLDPYGQPYDDESDEDDEDDDQATGEQGRGLRSLGIAESVDEDDEGWDDERPLARPTTRSTRFGTFWQDVRDWIDARRQSAAPATDADDDDDDAGWDDEPQPAPRVTRLAAAQPEETDGEGWDEDEDEAEAPPVAAPRRLFGRADRHPLADDEDAAIGERREPTARLPIVPPVIAYNDEHDEDEHYVASPQRERRRSPAGVLTGGLLFALVAIAAVLLLVLYIVLPTATVTLAARTGQVATDFKVVVAEIDPNSPQGQPTNERIVIPAKRLIVPLNATASRTATGTRSEPNTTASGPVVLINSARSTETVQRGTRLRATNGREYVTQEAITIGPADPLAETYGSATVTVAAALRGSGGNAATGTVSGQLSNTIDFTNRNAPIVGGSDRTFSTIAQQDIDAARAAAEDAARGKGQGALAAAIPSGSTVMHDTTGVDGFKTTTDLQVGADGDKVTATTTANATTLVYTPGTVEAQARAEAEKRIAAATKPGEPIVDGSVQIAAPQVIEDVPGQLTYRITGTAQTRAAIGSDADRAALAKALAHQDDDQAHAILAALPGISSAKIDYRSGPFPQRMPWLASSTSPSASRRGAKGCARWESMRARAGSVPPSRTNSACWPRPGGRCTLCAASRENSRSWPRWRASGKSRSWSSAFLPASTAPKGRRRGRCGPSRNAWQAISTGYRSSSRMSASPPPKRNAR